MNINRELRKLKRHIGRLLHKCEKAKVNTPVEQSKIDNLWELHKEFVRLFCRSK